MPIKAQNVTVPPAPDWLTQLVNMAQDYIPDLLSREPAETPAAMMMPEYGKDWLQGLAVDPNQMMYESLTNQMGGGQPLAQVSARGYEPLIEKLTDRFWRRFNPQFVTSPKSAQDIVPLVVRFPESGLPEQLLPELLGRAGPGGKPKGVYLNLQRHGIWGGSEVPTLMNEGNVIMTSGRDPAVVRHEGTHFLTDLLALGKSRHALTNSEEAAKDFVSRANINPSGRYPHPSGRTAGPAVEQLLRDLPYRYPGLAEQATKAWGEKYMQEPLRMGDELLASFMERTPEWWGNPIAALKENPWLYKQKAYQGLADMLSSYNYIPKEAFGKLGFLPPALLGVSMMGSERGNLE